MQFEFIIARDLIFPMFKIYIVCTIIILLSLIAHTTLGVIVLEANRGALTSQCQSSLFPYEIVMTAISSILPLIAIYYITRYIIAKACSGHISLNLELSQPSLRILTVILLGLIGWSIFIYVDLNQTCKTYYENVHPNYLKFFYATFWYYIGLTGLIFLTTLYLDLKVRYLVYKAQNTIAKEANRAIDQAKQMVSHQQPTSSVGNSQIPRNSDNNHDYYQSNHTIPRLQPQFSLDGIPVGFTDVDLDN